MNFLPMASMLRSTFFVGIVLYHKLYSEKASYDTNISTLLN